MRNRRLPTRWFKAELRRGFAAAVTGLASLRPVLVLTLLLGLFATGCGSRKKRQTVARPAPARAARSHSAQAWSPFTPERVLVGQVERVYASERFVMLKYPIGHVPPVGQHLILYRGGQKVGEVRVSNPQNEDHTPADILSGEAQAGDEVRLK